MTDLLKIVAMRYLARVQVAADDEGAKSESALFQRVINHLLLSFRHDAPIRSGLRRTARRLGSISTAG